MFTKFYNKYFKSANPTKLQCATGAKRVCIIVLTLFVVLVLMCVSQSIQYDRLHATYISADGAYKSTISRLEADKAELELNVDRLTNENTALSGYNVELAQQVQELTKQAEELTAQVEELNKQLETGTNKRDFKSYMPYTALTDKTSPQWQLQLQATTDEDGIRRYNGLPMIAVGTGWGLNIGDTALVVCENGNSFLAIVGDWKADRHTDDTNKTTLSNGCRCEFIVEKSKLNEYTRIMGNIATISKYEGYVVSIIKISLPGKS